MATTTKPRRSDEGRDGGGGGEGRRRIERLIRSLFVPSKVFKPHFPEICIARPKKKKSKATLRLLAEPHIAMACQHGRASFSPAFTSIPSKKRCFASHHRTHRPHPTPRSSLTHLRPCHPPRPPTSTDTFQTVRMGLLRMAPLHLRPARPRSNNISIIKQHGPPAILLHCPLPCQSPSEATAVAMATMDTARRMAIPP